MKILDILNLCHGPRLRREDMRRGLKVKMLPVPDINGKKLWLGSQILNKIGEIKDIPSEPWGNILTVTFDRYNYRVNLEDLVLAYNF